MKNWTKIKKIINKATISSLFFLFLFLFGVQTVWARPTLENAEGFTKTVAQGAGVAERAEVSDVVSTVIKTGLSLVAVIFFLLFFYGGFNWMTARGNEQQIEKSKKTVTAAVIGLVVVLGAYAVTALVGSFLG